MDDFSSKLDLPRALETVESIDANHMQMVRYSSREDYGYRAICGVLKATIREGMDRGSLACQVRYVYLNAICELLLGCRLIYMAFIGTWKVRWRLYHRMQLPINKLSTAVRVLRHRQKLLNIREQVLGGRI